MSLTNLQTPAQTGLLVERILVERILVSCSTADALKRVKAPQAAHWKIGDKRSTPRTASTPLTASARKH